ncbi:hypothetical protein [Knoellia subterranea]|uniref:Uncharacterized protein n=1 Tax=Knoellia subterranea KCTC 19937 TaxID=1385521 RepID=A0A0A0JLP1_9MICO|nr:hypothetical protein [Knoellia subterranea]KGN36531.1 hypothetical protein N803_04365 [Knoellia subterranea KCTC 19937]
MPRPTDPHPGIRTKRFATHSRDPDIAEGMRGFVEKSPDSPISAAIRDGSIEVRDDLVQAKPVTSATGHVSVRTRVTEMILQRDRIQLPD